jgi:hypothetical protein
MRDLIRTSALILVFTAGVAAAQQPSSQTSPQNGQSPASVEEEANKAAKERIESAPSSEGATIEDARGKGNPKSDQVVGPPNAGPVPLRGDGRDLPGASPQTVPAKFSERIAAEDDMPIMARPVNLSDEQKAAIWKAVGDKAATANDSKGKIFAEAGVFLPPNVEAQPFPEGATGEIAALRGLKYVKAGEKLLIVQPANGIVRGVIEE